MKAFLHAALTAVLILHVLTGTHAQKNDSTKKLSPDHWARTRNVDVKHISLELKFDWKKKQAAGNAVITLAPLTSTERITLDAGMLTINSITLPDGTGLEYKYDGSDKNDALEIVLNKKYNTGEDVVLNINYHTNYVNSTDPNGIWGSTGKGIRFFEPSASEPRRRKQLWSMGEPESNRYWFPCFDGPNDFRTTEMRATVERPLTAISNGVLVETKSNADGTQTFYYRMDRPYPNHHTSIVAGEYTDVKQQFEDISLHSLSYPDEVAATTATVERLPEMIKFFSELTAVKYPGLSYTQVFVQELPWGSANAGAATQTENMVDDFGTHADYLYLWDNLEGESLAGQWFGNYVAPKDWSHAWLHKGLSRYVASMYSEQKNGRAEFLLWQHVWDMPTALGDWAAGIRQPVVNRNYDDLAAFAGSNHPYFRGALVSHMLRKELGDENWTKTIRHYLQENAGKPVTTEDLRRSAEEVSGKSLDWFFDQWLYKTGHPVFVVTKNYDGDKKELTLNLKQTQQAEDALPYGMPEFFQGTMEIEIDGKIEKVWIEPKAVNTFTFATSQQPSLVNVDYEGTWIKEMKFEKSLDELIYQAKNDTDVVARRWALSQLVTLGRNEMTTNSDKEKIYATFRSVIQSKAYWRLRFLAIGQLSALLVPPGSVKPVWIDKATTDVLLNTIKNDKAWVRTAAINLLGNTRDAKYADVYLRYLDDQSDRVVNAAAIALGKSKSAKALPALVKLRNKPSWKNQSLISALNGLKELNDPKGLPVVMQAMNDLHSPRWTLAVSTWDFRIAAAETLVAMNKGDAGYPIILERFKRAMSDDDVCDIFNNTLLVATLADPRGTEVFEALKAKYRDDPNAMVAVAQYEAQFLEAIKKPN